MPNGCMCCRVRADLVDALKRLIASASALPAPEPQAPERAGLLPADGTGDAADSSGGSMATNTSSTGDKSEEGVTLSAAASGVPSLAADGAGAQVLAPAEQRKESALDGIILECSGLDELAPVLQVGTGCPERGRACLVCWMVDKTIAALTRVCVPT